MDKDEARLKLDELAQTKLRLAVRELNGKRTVIALNDPTDRTLNIGKALFEDDGQTEIFKLVGEL